LLNSYQPCALAEHAGEALFAGDRDAAHIPPLDDLDA